MTEVTMINEQGEQTQYGYCNKYDKLTNLVNCVMQYQFHRFDWWSELYKRKAEEIEQQIESTAHFYTWVHPTRNVSFLTRTY